MKRWVIYPLIALMALSAVAYAVELKFERDDQHRYPMRGELIDVGGHRLNLNCTGTGSPTVVLIPGAGETSAVWGWVAPMVARQSRVCVYDRAGRGWSDAAPAPQDGVALAKDLHRLLLRRLGAEPVVLVGHSVGGLYARVFAMEYPAQVAGVVLLDATHPEMFTRVARYPKVYKGYATLSAFFPMLARFGVGRLVYQSNFDSLPPLAREQQRAFWSTAALARSQHEEWLMIPKVMNQAAGSTLGALPLAVVTAVRGAEPEWLPLQEELAGLSSNSVHQVVAEASHMSLVDSRGDAAHSASAIGAVVQAVRSGQPLRYE